MGDIVIDTPVKGNCKEETVCIAKLQEVKSEADVLLLGCSAAGKSSMINVMLGLAGSEKAVEGNMVEAMRKSFKAFSNQKCKIIFHDTEGMDVMGGAKLISSYGKFIASPYGPRHLRAVVIIVKEFQPFGAGSGYESLHTVMTDRYGMVVAVTHAVGQISDMDAAGQNWYKHLEAHFPKAKVVRVNLKPTKIGPYTFPAAGELELAQAIVDAIAVGQAVVDSWTEVSEKSHGLLTECTANLETIVGELMHHIDHCGEDDSVAEGHADATWRAFMGNSLSVFGVTGMTNDLKAHYFEAVKKCEGKLLEFTPDGFGTAGLLLFLLLPVVGWFLGGAMMAESKNTRSSKGSARRLRAFGNAWLTQLVDIYRERKGVITSEFWTARVDQTWGKAGA